MTNKNKSTAVQNASDIDLLRLKEFEFKETNSDGELEYQLNRLSISDFSLFIGDNAQGKTRLFKTLIYLRELFSGRARRIGTVFYARFLFETPGVSKLEYVLDVLPLTDTNSFSEKVTKDGKVLFSTEDKILFDEKTGEPVTKFFVANNIPALVSITESGFRSINSIRSYFQRIAVAHTGWSTDSIVINNEALVPHERGVDLASVLGNWQTKFEDRFNRVVKDFRRCFSFVEKIDLVEAGVPGKLLALSEKAVKKQIIQMEWSEGLRRALWLITLANVEFKHNGSHLPPSLVCIDEIENSLDYKSLKFLVGYFRDLSQESQVIVTSHSPLVCDFVPPVDWRVFRRKGSAVNGFQPSDLDEELEKSLDFFERKHWEFYVKHLASLKLHKV